MLVADLTGWSVEQVEVKTKALETEGVELEKSLRRQADPQSDCMYIILIFPQVGKGWRERTGFEL